MSAGGRFPRSSQSSSRGPQRVPSVNQWPRMAGSQNVPAPQNVVTSRKEVSGADKFKEAARFHEDSIKKALNALDVDDSDDEELPENIDDILKSVFQSFSSLDETGNDIGTSKNLLKQSYLNSTTCLVCIESIKKTDAIWSCTVCFSMLHIPCIQKWVREGVYFASTLNEDVDRSLIPWNCPKCRNEYPQSACPSRYFCYCGKTQDPKFDPWSIPHSCGESCGKPLQPECGHMCLLLCHPGPCPPCPQTIKSKCFCAKTTKLMRCSRKEWSCNQACNRLLSCGLHRCSVTCHRGDCMQCPQKRVQKCFCGRKEESRSCAEAGWSCAQICGRPFSCGSHVCEKPCHTGDCGTCPRSGTRTCPCGKTVYKSLPCTQDVQCCGYTCSKLLACGLHQCVNRCHTGECGQCNQLIVKQCRCGLKKKELLCWKEYTCENKCQKVRNCGRHQCKKKCCLGECPPCDQACGRTLNCRNHKCASRCHQGLCYPCPERVVVSCRCGATKVTVPCGREKVTKPPRCNARCEIPPICHHPARQPHHCHFGECPVCTQICDKARKCGHRCSAACHSAVKVQVQEKVQRMGPWEPIPEVRFEFVDQPCPPCPVLVTVQCLGEHETCNMPCAEAHRYTCGRRCGRLLACGNHPCHLECHRVFGATNVQQCGSNCTPCDDGCLKPRPAGCTHQCPLPCHSGECPRCAKFIKTQCHCQIAPLLLECAKWCAADEQLKTQMKSCGNPCPKKLSCGHPCPKNCHPGPCADPKECSKKTTLRCPCKRKKEVFPCVSVQKGEVQAACDNVCQEILKEKQLEEEAKLKMKEKEEEEKNRREVEEFNKKSQAKRKKRKGKEDETSENESFFSQYWKLIGAISLALVVIAFLIQNFG